MVEEQTLLIGPSVGNPEVPLHGVTVKEVLRRLHDADIGIVEKADGTFQEPAVGHEIRIEDGDIIARCLRKGIIDVPRLGVLMLGTGDVVRAVLLAKCTQPIPVAVIEDMHREMRVIEVQRTYDGALQDV